MSRDMPKKLQRIERRAYRAAKAYERARDAGSPNELALGTAYEATSIAVSLELAALAPHVDGKRARDRVMDNARYWSKPGLHVGELNTLGEA